MDPKLIKKANFYVQQQSATLEDDIIQLGQSKDVTFHQVLNVKSYDDDYTDADGYLVAVYLRSDKLYDTYDRKVTDLLTVMGDVGGLFQFALGLGIVLIGFVTQKMFMSRIIKKTYHIRNYDNIVNEAKQQLTARGG